MEETASLESPADECIGHNKQVQRVIKSLVREHEAKWLKMRTDLMIGWFSHSTSMASMLCVVLYIVSLFFVNPAFQSTTRLIVEASMFLAFVVLSMLLKLYLAWMDHTAAVAPVKHLLKNFKYTDMRLIEDVTTQISLSAIKDIVRQTIMKRTREYRRAHPSPLDRILILVHDHVIVGLVISIAITLLVAIIRVAALPGAVREQWVWLFLERQIYVLLPLLELIAPLAFFLANSLQNSRVLAIHQLQQLAHQHKEHLAADINPWSPGGPVDDQKDDSSDTTSSRRKSHDRKARSSSPSSSSSDRSSSSESSYSSHGLEDSSDSDFQQYSVPVNSLGDLEAGKRSTATLPVPRRLAPAVLTRDYFYRTITGDALLGCLPRHNVADFLANVTTLACVDQRPVRESHPFAEKVLLLGRMRDSHSRSGSGQLLHSSMNVPNLKDATEAAARNVVFTYDHMPKLHRGASAFPMILHLQRKLSNELEFIDAGWRTFLPLLKPLGLNCMLTGAYSESQHDMDLSDFEEGLRKLAKAIGFSDTTTSAYEFVLELRYDMARRRRISRTSFSRKTSKSSLMKDLHDKHSREDASTPRSHLAVVPEQTEPKTSVSSDSEVPDSEVPESEIPESDAPESDVPPSSTTIPSESEEKINEEDDKSSTTAEDKTSKKTLSASASDSRPPSRNPTPVPTDDSVATKGSTPSKASGKVSQHSSGKRHMDSEPSETPTDTKASQTEDASQVEQLTSEQPHGDSAAPSTTSPADRTTIYDGRSPPPQEIIQSHPMSERATYLVIRNLQTSKLELMTTGDPLVVLSHCNQYWNGSEIKRLTSSDRRTIRQVLYHWSNHQTFLCVGHSYRPVPPDYYGAVISAGSQVLKTSSPGAAGAPRSIRTSHGNTRQNRAQSISSYESEDFVDLEEIKNDQIWIGLVGLRHQPKPMAPLFVDQLDASYIRFVYYSEESETRSKVFADKLGLETGWNSFITLKERPAEEEEKPKDDHSIQKLPVGVSNVRGHLRDIDNVPLLVSLFVDATPSNKAEMIDIAEENGEVVFVVGTVSDPDNSKAFLECHIGYGMLPVDRDNDEDEEDDTNGGHRSAPGVSAEQASNDFSDDSSDGTKRPRAGSSRSTDRKHRKKKKKRKAELESAQQFLENEGETGSLVTDILRLSCQFMSTKHNTFIDILELITLGRRLEQQTLMFSWLFFSAFAALNLHQVLSNILFVSPTLTGIQLYYLGFLILPLQAFSLLWNPRPPGLASLISEKNVKKHKARIIRYLTYAIIRLFPMIIVCLILFVWTLWWTWIPVSIPSVPNAPSQLQYIFGATKGVAGYDPYTDPAFINALSFSQNVTLFAFTLYIVTASASCMHRTLSLLVVNPKRNLEWIVASIVSILLAVVYFLISEHSNLYLFTHIQPYMYIVLFGWVPCQLLLDELVKRNMKNHFSRTQDILKLDYNTKLGMYSPI